MAWKRMSLIWPTILMLPSFCHVPIRQSQWPIHLSWRWQAAYSYTLRSTSDYLRPQSTRLFSQKQNHCNRTPAFQTSRCTTRLYSTSTWRWAATSLQIRVSIHLRRFEKYFDQFKQGEALWIKDELIAKAKVISQMKTFSYDTFKRHLPNIPPRDIAKPA